MSAKFDSVAKHYAHRIPYLRLFFRKASEALALTAESRLLDLACGRGDLARGFARFSGEIVAADISEEMLAEARSGVPGNVSLRKVDLNRAESDRDFLNGLGLFHAVVIGRALRYLERAPLTALLNHALRDGGTVMFCGTALHPTTPWAVRYFAVGHEILGRDSRSNAAWRSRFDEWEYAYHRTVMCRGERRFSIAELAENLASHRSIAAHIGGDIGGVEQRLESALAPYVQNDGLLTATLVSWGSLYRRPERGG